MDKLNVRTIAKSVDLSPITVSRALNGHPGVKTATRNKILKKVNELGYNYQSKSTTVRNNRAKRIAIHCIEEKLHGDIYFNFYGQLYFNLIHYLKKLGYTGYTVDLSKERDENAKIIDKCGTLILMNEVPSAVLNGLRKKRSDMNVISIFAEVSDSYTICPDDFHGGQIAAANMIRNGHRHAAVFTVLDELCFRLRYAGFHTEMTYHAPGSRVDLIRFNNPLNHDDADRLELEALENYFDNVDEMPTAVFATNGYAAIFLSNFLKKRGYRIPEDISLIGYDNYDYYQVIDVSLSRVCFDLKALANQVVQLLNNVVKKNVSGNYNILTPVKFIDKKSVKKI